jgi:hypothetical protein
MISWVDIDVLALAASAAKLMGSRHPRSPAPAVVRGLVLGKLTVSSKD